MPCVSSNDFVCKIGTSSQRNQGAKAVRTCKAWNCFLSIFKSGRIFRRVDLFSTNDWFRSRFWRKCPTKNNILTHLSFPLPRSIIPGHSLRNNAWEFALIPQDLVSESRYFFLCYSLSHLAEDRKKNSKISDANFENQNRNISYIASSDGECENWVAIPNSGSP